MYVESNSDIVQMNPYSADGDLLIYNRREQSKSIVSANSDGIFRHSYKSIAVANDPLALIEAAEASGEPLFPVMSAQDKIDLDRISGELYFAKVLHIGTFAHIYASI